MIEKKFETGKVYLTKGIDELMSSDTHFRMFVSTSLGRYIQGDWGNLCEEDQRLNEQALIDGDRLMGSYTKGEKKIWIITEADRSTTTILLPEEY